MWDKKWLQVTGLALSFPTTILVSAWVMKILVDNETITKFWGIIIFLAIICNTIYLMVYYAFKNKNKP